MRRFSAFIFRFTILIVFIWILGLGLSDRWYWTQWLEWIPTLSVLLLLLITAIALLSTHKKKEAMILVILFCGLITWFLFIENRVFSTSKATGGFRIAAWTMSHSKKEVSKESAMLLVHLDADITLLTHGWYVRGEPVIKDWLSTSGKLLMSGPFTLLTTLRPLEVRTLVASDGIYISLYRLDTAEQLGKELVIYAIDLPSNLNESRKNIVQRAKRLLHQVDAPEPNMVIGDFNMTRNSQSMIRFFPKLTDAWDLAGVGWSYSYHRAFPLFHIDHILLNTDFKPIAYELQDPEFGRHCIQILELSQQK
jgi:hypothetical protein